MSQTSKERAHKTYRGRWRRKGPQVTEHCERFQLQRKAGRICGPVRSDTSRLVRTKMCRSFVYALRKCEVTHMRVRVDWNRIHDSLPISCPQPLIVWNGQLIREIIGLL